MACTPAQGHKLWGQKNSESWRPWRYLLEPENQHVCRVFRLLSSFVSTKTAEGGRKRMYRSNHAKSQFILDTHSHCDEHCIWLFPWGINNKALLAHLKLGISKLPTAFAGLLSFPKAHVWFFKRIAPWIGFFLSLPDKWSRLRLECFLQLWNACKNKPHLKQGEY